MAQSVVISTKELQRQAALCFEGKTINVMLCTVGLTGYTAESLVTDWQTVEASGLGYVRYSGTIATGSYSVPLSAYVLPNVEASFTATGAGYSYDTIVTYITGETYPHSIVTESPGITMLSGQVQTYRLSLRQDD